MKTDFEVGPDGNIKLCPMTGWAVTPAAGMLGVLQIFYVDNPDQLASGKAQSLQLGILPGPAREFGQALLRLADRLEKTQENGIPQ